MILAILNLHIAPVPTTKFRSNLKYGSRGHHARIQKVLSEGVQLNKRFFFFVFLFCVFDEGREEPSTTISGPSSARQRNAIKWHFAGVSMMAQH